MPPEMSLHLNPHLNKKKEKLLGKVHERRISLKVQKNGVLNHVTKNLCVPSLSSSHFDFMMEANDLDDVCGALAFACHAEG
jgi:hypothetical protein